MMLIIYWKNNKPFKLEISDSKTLLDLKQEIAKHYGENFTGFNVLNGSELIDSSKNSSTLRELGIKRLIRLPLDYNPGNFK
jgi:hypothetical protein